MDTAKNFKIRLLMITISLTLLFTSALVYGMYHRYYYFASLMALFFILPVFSWYYIQKKGDRWDNYSLIVVLSICFFLGVIIEFIAVYLKFWTFFTDIDPLLGITIGDIPIEEFIFYFGANMQICFLYVAVSLKCDNMGLTTSRFHTWFKKQQSEKKIPSDTVFKWIIGVAGVVVLILCAIGLMNRYKKERGISKPEEKYRDKRNLPIYIDGVWYPGWMIAIVPFLSVGVLWFRAVIKRINVAAFLFSLVLNITIFILFEYNAIMRGHWVYNEQRLIGWRFAGTVPIEQLILYLVSFLFLIPFFESVRYFFIVNLGTAEEKRVYAQQIGDEQLINSQDCKEYLLTKNKITEGCQG